MIIFRLLGKTPTFEIRMSGTGTLNLDKIIEIFLYQQFPDMVKAYKSISELSEEKRNLVFEKNPDIKVKLEAFEKEKNKFVEIMKQVKYIHNGKMITNQEEIKVSNESQDYLICVYSQNNKEFVEKFFKAKGKVKVAKTNDLDKDELVGSIKTEVPKPEVLSEKKKNDRLQMFKEKIGDKDFCYLINIFQKKPELFTSLLAYVESGNIVITESEEVSTLDELKEKYSEELSLIKKLELSFSDDNILKGLHNYKGDVDMTLRYLLCSSHSLEKSVSTEVSVESSI